MNCGIKLMITAGCCLIANCAMVSSVHTAKTLDPGIASISISADGAGVTYFLKDSIVTTDTTKSDHLTIPNASLIPNLHFQVGVKENLEIGAMFVPMMFGFEGSVKYRFFNENGNHLAVVPYGAFYLFKNYTGGSQMVYTKEFSGGLSLNVAGFGSYTYLDNTSYLSDEVIPSSRYLAFGGVAGPQFSMDAVFFTPSVEYNIFIPLDEEASFTNMQTFRFSIAVGFYIGKSKKQLDRIENKIDVIDKKLDKKQ